MSILTSVDGSAIPQGGLSVREAAVSLGVSCQVIYLLHKQQKIRLVETAHGKVVPLDIMEFLRQRWRR